jgi:transitional endoplasmic reticulum ATPase
LPIRNKLLLYGVTGNGKTTIARHIACLANIPFVSVFSEGVLDSKLGHSGQNIAKILTQITQPCVLFWDEIDNIAQKRGGGESSSALENDRIVNSFLVNMDKLSNDVIFIAATNRRNVLDTAFLRRFDVQFELVAPTIEEKERFAKQLIAYYNLPEMYLQEPYEQCSSYSEVKNDVC